MNKNDEQDRKSFSSGSFSKILRSSINVPVENNVRKLLEKIAEFKSARRRDLSLVMIREIYDLILEALEVGIANGIQKVKDDPLAFDLYTKSDYREMLKDEC